jgi:hypothetical protein
MVNALTSWQFHPGTVDLLLHQTLHGYAEGHHLIESSIVIPDDLKRLMLRMSDLSGTSVVTGFQEYLTGYPLPSLGAYALAKTWYAAEMARPGCVWTHTFIVPAPVLARIPSLSAVQPLFRRPSERANSDYYSKPILLDPAPSTLDGQRSLDQMTQMRVFLSSHYQKDWHPLVIPTTNSDEFTDLIFAAWSQKWPALRLGFTFCTGSLSARTLEKRPLDIQCVPIAASRQIARDVAEAGFGEPILMNFDQPDSPTWTISAANDALQSGGGALREFLWSVADADSTQIDFESLVKVYDAFTESLGFSSIVNLIADLFPDPMDGQHLKTALLENQSNLPIPRIIDLKEVLLALATTDRYSSFEPLKWLITQRACRLFTEQRSSGYQLVGELLRASLNPFGDEILTSLIAAMRPEDALVFLKNQPQFFPTLFRANPRLAVSKQVWLAAEDSKRQLFESLVAHQKIEPEVIRGIVNALLDSHSDGFIRQAVDRWGQEAVFQTLDWSEAHNGSITEACRAALSFHVCEVMNWIGASRSPSTAVLASIARIVAPYASQVAQNDSTVWVHAFHALRESNGEKDANYLSTFLLALGLCNAPPVPLDLISESFEIVHKRAEDEKLGDDEWFVLQPLVPDLGWLKNWDKCERIRQALISAFMRHSWPAWELTARVRDYETLHELFKSARKVGGDYYFRSLLS